MLMSTTIKTTGFFKTLKWKILNAFLRAKTRHGIETKLLDENQQNLELPLWSMCFALQKGRPEII